MLFRESGTLGVRRRPSVRRALDRETYVVEIHGRSVRIKCAYLDGARLTAAPEFEDLKSIADETGVPIRQLRGEAMALLADPDSSSRE